MTRILPNSRMAWEMSLLFGGICLLCVGLLYTWATADPDVETCPVGVSKEIIQ